jgi:hypothetical protein
MRSPRPEVQRGHDGQAGTEDQRTAFVAEAKAAPVAASIAVAVISSTPLRHISCLARKSRASEFPQQRCA